MDQRQQRIPKKRYVKPHMKKHGSIKIMSWGSPGFEEEPRRR